MNNDEFTIEKHHVNIMFHRNWSKKFLLTVPFFLALAALARSLSQGIIPEIFHSISVFILLVSNIR